MKLLVFAHTPPPHHGLSYMIQQMLDGLRQESESGSGIEIFHVNARFSSGADDIGSARPAKLLLLLKYCLQALWLRFRHGCDTFYYVPAPAKKSALLRDFLILILCRPFFRNTVFQWHSLGLGEWTSSQIQNPQSKLHNKIAARIALKLFSHATLSISLTSYGKRDAAVFSPKKLVVIANGIPDPCPDFETSILPNRLRRHQHRNALPLQNKSENVGPSRISYRFLFLAHCTREKGLFDTLDAIALLNRQLANNNQQLQATLTVAGQFLSETEKQAFERRILQPDLTLPATHLPTTMAVHYAGFVGGAEKDRLLRECDCLCFPSYFPTEAQPVSLIEAMAYGLNIVVSDWRALPECLPFGMGNVVPTQSPQLLAEALAQTMIQLDAEALRSHFTQKHTLNAMIESLKSSLQALE